MPSALQAIQSTGSRRTAATVLAAKMNWHIRSPPQTATQSTAVSGWMSSRTVRWSARRAHDSTKTPPTSSASLLCMDNLNSAAIKKEFQHCVPAAETMEAAARISQLRQYRKHLNSFAALHCWSVKDCRASRTAGQIYPVLRTAPVIKRWATVWRYPAWSLSCRASLPRFYEAQR